MSSRKVLEKLSERELGRLAYYLMTELTIRWRVRRRYLKVYRYINYFLGPDVAQYILRRLSETRYLSIEGEYVVCRRPVPVRKSLTELEKEVHRYLAELCRRVLSTRSAYNSGH